jgi:hypothetical protein
MTITNPELTQVRAEADKLGVKYHHRAGVAKIQGLIDNHLPQTTSPVPAAVVKAEPVQRQVPKAPVVLMTAKQFKDRKLAQQRLACTRLIRVRIQCMNPNKKDWPGEIISTGSAKLGTFKKYIPFNSPEPYHIPKIIFDVLSEKKCSVFYNETARLGHAVRKSRLVPEYAIEVLEPLTPEQLSELARTQALAAGQGA